MVSVTLGTKAKNYDFCVADVGFGLIEGAKLRYSISLDGITIATNKSNYVELDGKFRLSSILDGNIEKGVKHLDSITVVENGRVSYQASDLDISGADLVSGKIFKKFLAGEDYAIRGNAYANELTGANATDVIRGMAGNDALTGLAGRDTLFGDDGADLLTGGLGNDRLSGGAGADVFVFERGDGRDIITDFCASGRGHDVIDLSDHRDVRSFRSLDISRAGSDVRIEAGDDVIMLKDVRLSEIDGSDFLF